MNLVDLKYGLMFYLIKKKIHGATDLKKQLEI